MMNIFNSAWQYISGLPAEVTGVAAGLLIAFILKVIPNAKIQNGFYNFMYKLGAAISFAATHSNVPWLKALYQRTIEDFLVDAIENIGVYGLRGFVFGLRSDNKKPEEINKNG